MFIVKTSSVLKGVVIVSSIFSYNIALAQTATNQTSDVTISALSKVKGLSVDVAKLRLSSMNRMGDVQALLKRSFPDTFSYVSTLDAGQTFTIGIKGSDSSKVLNTITAIAQGLNISIKQVSMSKKDRTELVDGIMNNLKTLKMAATISINERTDEVRILTKDPDAVKAAIAAGTLKVPSGVIVEESEGIILTDINWAGGSYINGQSGNTLEGCTAGFTVVDYDLTTPQYPFYGFVSAGHCIIANMKVDAYPNTTYPTSSAVSASLTSPFGILNDAAFFQFSNQSTNHPRSGFWDGSQYTDLTGITEDYHGEFLCKYGRTSGKTCGFVEDVKTTDAYGTFSKVLATPAYPKQSVEGDSGGPVFITSSAAGIVHGRSANYDLYYSAATTWRAATGYKVFYIIGSNGYYR